MHTFTLTNSGTAIDKLSGKEYQIFIGQNNLWFICRTESDIKNAIFDIQELSVCSEKKIIDILAKYQIFWSDNAVIKSDDPSFKGFPPYDIQDICKLFLEK